MESTSFSSEEDKEATDEEIAEGMEGLGEDSEKESVMSDEEIREILGSKNEVPKPKGLAGPKLSISVAEIREKKSKGRPKGSKARY